MGGGEEHASLCAFIETVKPQRVFALTTKGKHIVSEVTFQAGDVLLFGPETRGLPETILADLGVNRCLYLPMQAESRSLNLSNTVSIVLYEAWRQLSFAGALIK